MPGGPPPEPVAARVRLRYAKRGRLRFASHRDFARAFERALRRAGVPVAFSAGFTPHPRVSYVGAAPTGAASEAEYLELALTERVNPDRLRATLDAALPPGFDVLDCVEARPGAVPLADLIDASAWRIELPGAGEAELRAALAAFLDQDSVEVERLTKDGRRLLDARPPVLTGQVVTDPADAPGRRTGPAGAPSGEPDGACAILDVVVRQATPAVRPDDVLAALRAVAGFEPPAPPRATRMAQGRLDGADRLADPFGPDRAALLLAAEMASPQVGSGPGPADRPAPSVGTTSAG